MNESEDPKPVKPCVKCGGTRRGKTGKRSPFGRCLDCCRQYAEQLRRSKGISPARNSSECAKCGSHEKTKHGRCKPCSAVASTKSRLKNSHRYREAKKESDKRYYLKNKDRLIALSKQRHLLNRDDILAQKKADRVKFPEKYKDQERRRVRPESFKEEQAARNRLYALRRPDVYRLATQRYRDRSSAEQHATEFFQMLEGIKQLSQLKPQNEHNDD